MGGKRLSFLQVKPNWAEDSVTATKQLAASVRNFLSTLRRDFSGEIAHDARGFRKQVLRLVRLGLPPRRGRPCDPRFDAALAMVKQRNTIKEVLRRQIPNFDQLDAYTRYLADKGLRQALARRRWLSTHRKRNAKMPHENHSD